MGDLGKPSWGEKLLLEFVDDEAVASLAAAFDGDLGVVVPNEVTMEQHLLQHGVLGIGVWLGPPSDLVVIIEDMHQILQHIQVGPNCTLRELPEM